MDKTNLVVNLSIIITQHMLKMITIILLNITIKRTDKEIINKCTMNLPDEAVLLVKKRRPILLNLIIKM